MNIILFGCLALLFTNCQRDAAVRPPKPIEEPAFELCTPNPSPEAQRVFDFLHSIYGTQTLSGTMANVNWNTNEAQWVYAHTGKWPAINGFDFLHSIWSKPNGQIDYENTETVEEWWNAGGLVTAMWHWNMLANNGEKYSFRPGTEANQTSFDIRKIDDTTSPEYRLMVDNIDQIAGYLKLLRDKNIPVIWRPLHEAAGNYHHTEWGGTAWFWWGYYGPEPFKKLWRLMFDRFVNIHQLNNLIWVWTYEDHTEWYPGDEYVDIVGSDIYNQSEASYFGTRYSDHGTLYDKMAALAECGNVTDIDEQWQSGAKWLYFMSWYDHARTKNPSSIEFESTEHKYCDVRWWNDILAQPYVLTRDRLPSFK